MALRFSCGRTLPSLLAFALACTPLSASLCKACRGKSHTKDLGTCMLCPEMTTSGSFQLCMTCSDRLQACEGCKADLPPSAGPLDLSASKSFTHGPWIYAHTLSNTGSRSEGTYGQLSFLKHPLPEPAINDFVHTPWGVFYWVGGQGWMKHLKPPQPEGHRVFPPLPAAESGASRATTISL